MDVSERTLLTEYRITREMRNHKGDDRSMNKKEIAEIKKLLLPTRQTISRIAGCYVSAGKEKIMTFSQSFALLEEEERFKYLEIFRKSLSGTIGKNLLDMEFPDEEETEGGRQSFLYRLRQSHLEEEDLLNQFYDRVIESYVTSDHYLILLIANAYDVPGRGTDGIEMFDASQEVYDYFQMAVCPVDLAKPALSYDKGSASFRSRIRDWIVGMPSLGLLFPAFTDRGNDIHSCLYYSRDAEDLHLDFTEAVLGCRTPLPAGLQKEAFDLVLEQSLGERCDFETVKEIHDALLERKEEHEDDPDPDSLGIGDVRVILSRAGVREEEIRGLEEAYEENIGKDERILASNIRAKNQFEVHTPDVTITVSPDRTDLVETRVIDGRKCIVIPVTDEVLVNGIHVR